MGERFLRLRPWLKQTARAEAYIIHHIRPLPRSRSKIGERTSFHESSRLHRPRAVINARARALLSRYTTILGRLIRTTNWATYTEKKKKYLPLCVCYFFACFVACSFFFFSTPHLSKRRGNYNKNDSNYKILPFLAAERVRRARCLWSRRFRPAGAPSRRETVRRRAWKSLSFDIRANARLTRAEKQLPELLTQQQRSLAAELSRCSLINF